MSRRPRSTSLSTMMAALAVILLVAGACTDTPTSASSGRKPVATLGDIVDATHGGVSHFYFTSPIASDPAPTGRFNGAARPTVEICEWTGSECAAVVASFSTAKGTGNAMIKVDAAAERYVVNWNTRQCRSGGCTLDPAKVYRVRVLVGGLEAGHVDLGVVAMQGRAKNMTTGEFITLVGGKTLPLRFRIEDGLTLRGPAASTGALHPNSRRYRDRAMHPATGRSGSATLEARALVGKDGTTIFEATTGALDATTAAPGNIEHVQLKLIGAEGDAVVTENFTGLTDGGRWTKTYGAFARHQPFQVQANISGIDGHRTDVVTVEGKVALRPDLAVVSLQAPERATPGSSAPVLALVREVNGDVGATADCVLTVDGTEVDRAVGIWVDGGDAVNCSLKATFGTTPGSQTVKVAVEGVTPADDDASNNSWTATVQVGHANQFAYRLIASEERYQAYTTLGREFFTSSDNSLNSSSHSELTFDGVFQNATLAASLPTEAVAFPLAHVEVAHASGESALGGLSYDNLAADYVDEGSFDDSYYGHYSRTVTWASRTEVTPSGRIGLLVQSETVSWTGGSIPAGSYAVTSLNSTLEAGTVTYFGAYGGTSSDSKCYGCDRSYEYNYGGEYGSGAPSGGVFGADYSVTGSLRGAGESAPTYALSARAPMTVTFTAPPTPETCSEYSWDQTAPDGSLRTVTYHWCSQSTGTFTLTSGEASGTP